MAGRIAVSGACLHKRSIMLRFGHFGCSGRDVASLGLAGSTVAEAQRLLSGLTRKFCQTTESPRITSEVAFA